MNKIEFAVIFGLGIGSLFGFWIGILTYSILIKRRKIKNENEK